MFGLLACAALALPHPLVATPTVQRGSFDLLGTVTWRDPAVVVHPALDVGALSYLQLRLDLSMPPTQGPGGELGYRTLPFYNRAAVGAQGFLDGSPAILTDVVVADGAAGIPDTITFEQSMRLRVDPAASRIDGRAALVILDVEGDAWAGATMGDVPSPLPLGGSTGTSAELTFFDVADVPILVVTFTSLVIDVSGEVGCTGFANTTGFPGRLVGTGSRAVADNSFGLLADRLPQESFGFFIVSPNDGFVMNPGGMQGLLCMSGPIGRFVGPGQIKNSGGSGTITLPLDLTVIPTVAGAIEVMVPGDTRYFQLWHRDSSAAGPVSNFSDSLAITFQ